MPMDDLLASLHNGLDSALTEKPAIECVLESTRQGDDARSPVTGLVLSSTLLTPNVAIRSMCMDHVEVMDEHKWFVVGRESSQWCHETCSSFPLHRLHIVAIPTSWYLRARHHDVTPPKN